MATTGTGDKGSSEHNIIRARKLQLAAKSIVIYSLLLAGDKERNKKRKERERERKCV